MNKIAIGALSFTAGLISGFIVAKFVEIELEEKNRTVVTAEDIRKDTQKKPEGENSSEVVDPAEAENPSDDDPDQLLSSGPAHIARPGQNGVDYSKVQKKVKEIVEENGYASPEAIQEVINDPENEETYEEREDRERMEMETNMAEYREKNKGKIVPITRDEWESDFREVDYDQEDLYYFAVDDVLTDKDGNVLDANEFMGPKPFQFGWFNNDDDRIYIRNNPKETDFCVWKEKCTSSDWWS